MQKEIESLRKRDAEKQEIIEMIPGRIETAIEMIMKTPKDPTVEPSKNQEKQQQSPQKAKDKKRKQLSGELHAIPQQPSSSVYLPTKN
jgi:hypothetical protein